MHICSSVYIREYINIRAELELDRGPRWNISIHSNIYASTYIYKSSTSNALAYTPLAPVQPLGLAIPSYIIT
jgi:hypothetical protein